MTHTTWLLILSAIIIAAAWLTRRKKEVPPKQVETLKRVASVASKQPATLENEMTTIKLTPAQIQQVLSENQTSAPPVKPPVVTPPPKPPVKPNPPVNTKPPVVHAPAGNMENYTASEIFGRELEYSPTGRGLDIMPIQDFRIHSPNGVSIAFTIPPHNKSITINMARAASRYGHFGVIEANFSKSRGFSNPISSEDWGNTALSAHITPSDNAEMIYFNARQKTSADKVWALHIQPSLHVEK